MRRFLDATLPTRGSALLLLCGFAAGCDDEAPAQDFPLVEQVVVGADHACALFFSGLVKCWGENASGQLGRLDVYRSAEALPVLGGAVSLSAGKGVTCAVTRDVGTWCWGSGNVAGEELTYSEPQQVSLPGAREIHFSLQGGCALTVAGTVQCWGNNDDGQLGDGTTKPREGVVTVPGLEGVRALSVSDYRHACAITEAQEVYCWGSLGNGGSLTPRKVEGLQGVTAIVSAQVYACGIAAGEVWCWGQLPNFEPTRVEGLSNIVGLSGSTFDTFALTAAGDVIAFDASRGPYAPEPLPKTSAIAGGYVTTCAIASSTDEVLCNKALGTPSVEEAWLPVAGIVSSEK